jgi:hypothetical protein
MKMAVFWVVAPCSLVDSHLRTHRRDNLRSYRGLVCFPVILTNYSFLHPLRTLVVSWSCCETGLVKLVAMIIRPQIAQDTGSTGLSLRKRHEEPCVPSGAVLVKSGCIYSSALGHIHCLATWGPRPRWSGYFTTRNRDCKLYFVAEKVLIDELKTVVFI